MKIFVLLFASLISFSLCWGPLSHMTWNCLGAYPSQSLNDCLCNEKFNSLNVGSDLPDAFYFGGYSQSSMAECSNLQYMHSRYFGAFMINHSLSGAADAYRTADFDPLQFSRGFLGHTIGDSVGFSEKGGMLISPKVGGVQSRWLQMWVYMLSLDAFNQHNRSICSSVVSKPFPATGYAFIADTTQKFHEQFDKNFQPLSSQVIQTCTENWEINVQTFLEEAKLQNQAQFGPQMIFYDSWNRTDLDAIKETYLAQSACSIKAISFINGLLNQGVNFQVAVNECFKHIDTLFDQGLCGVPK